MTGRNKLARWAIGLALGAVGFFAVPLVLPAAGAPAVRANVAAPTEWSPAVPFDFGNHAFQHSLDGVSCASPSLCVTVDVNGDVVTTTDPTDPSPTWVSQSVFDGYPLYGISCPSTALCVAVGDLGSLTVSTDPAQRASATWTEASVDNTSAIVAVSCASTNLCVAIDISGNVVTSTDPGSPTPTWTVTNVDSTTNNNYLAGISCPTTTFCAAVDSAGNYLTSTDPGDGASAAWTVTKITTGDVGFYGISCPSESFCGALETGSDVVTTADPTDGASATWTPPANIDTPTNYAATISCSSASLCAAGDGYGNIAASSDPGGGASQWTLVNADPPNNNMGIGSTNRIEGMSCDPTAAFCLAVDRNGHAVTSTDPTGGASAWTVTQANKDVSYETNVPTAVSCPTDSFCEAVDAYGNVLSTTDPADGSSATWSPTPDVDPSGFGFVSVACPTESLCVAVDLAGYVAVSTDPAAAKPTWSLSAQSIDNGNAVFGLSCPSASFCVAAADFGNVVTSTDPTNPASWTVVNVDGKSKELLGVSCPSAGFCAAVDSSGFVVTSKDPADGAGATWTPTASSVDGGNSLVAVSCASTALCVAVDGTKGDVVVSSDPTDSSPTWTTDFTGPGSLDSVDCPSTSVCVATGRQSPAYGREVTTTDPTGGFSAWSSGQLPSTDDLDGISCPNVGMCLAVGSAGYFTRTLAPPSATTGAGSSSSGTTATLTGTVNPDGWPITNCHFVYGTDSTSTVPCDVSLPIPGTSGDISVSAKLSGLSPDTTYDFHLEATSFAGTSSGDTQEFTTGDSVSTGTTETATTQTTTETTDTTPSAPVLGHLTVVPRTFKSAHGGKVSYRDTAAATTRFTVQRKMSGKKAGGWRSIGSFSRRDVAGSNHFHFTGRMKQHALAPGRYRLRAVAGLHGLESNRVQAMFRIKG